MAAAAVVVGGVFLVKKTIGTIKRGFRAINKFYNLIPKKIIFIFLNSYFGKWH